METYVKQPKPSARTLSARAGHRQPDMATILQTYRNRTAQLAALKGDEEETLQGNFTMQLQEEEDEVAQGKFVAQLQEDDEEETLQGKFVTQLQSAEEEEPLQQKAENRTGLPDRLKNGVESLSGYSLDAVKVHYNSPKPAQLQALAYTQGTDIHVGPGQERYLGHEAWHVVQQMQGRVQPTTQLQGVAVNDNEGLEREADVMGEKAVQRRTVVPFVDNRINKSERVMQMRLLDNAQYKTFVANTYTKEYNGALRSDNPGTGIGFAGFKATYQPGAVAEKLFIELPIKLDPAFPADKAKYYIQNVEKTWSNKFHIKTKNIEGGKDNGWIFTNLVKTPKNLWDKLNDVNVIVRAKETTGMTGGFWRFGKKPESKFNLTYNKKDIDYVSADGAVALSKQGYDDTKYAWDHKKGYNVYGHETGHMFGLDDEYQIGNGDYEISSGIKAYDKVSKKVKVYPQKHNQTMKHWGKDYRIWKVNKKDNIDKKGFRIKINRDGVKKAYTYEEKPVAEQWILLNDTQKKRSDALPGTLTDHYNLTKKAFGKKYANKNAVMDDTKITKTIMGSGTQVKKHHYVTFWDAMVQAIQGQYGGGPSNKAPNQHDDWQII